MDLKYRYSQITCAVTTIIKYHYNSGVYSSTVFDLFPPPFPLIFFPKINGKGGGKPWTFEKLPPPTGGGNVELYTALYIYMVDSHGFCPVTYEIWLRLQYFK